MMIYVFYGERSHFRCLSKRVRITITDNYLSLLCETLLNNKTVFFPPSFNLLAFNLSASTLRGTAILLAVEW